MKANELDGTNPYATYFAAAAKLAAHRREEALSLYQRTVEIDPHHGFGWLGLGWTHLDLDRKTDSLWCLERACELERGDAEAKIGPTAGVSGYLGECLRRCGDLGSARERCLAGIEAAEKSDHMFRDSFRGVGLCALGRTALDQGDLEAARAAFGQAVAHLRGRPRTLGGGYLLVQALAGLTRAGAGQSHLDEALDRFRKREGANFSWLWMCSEDISLLELSRAALAIGREREAEELHRAALEAGSREAAAPAK
jgi:tetratricopeptide (TPR) repeat protein